MLVTQTVTAWGPVQWKKPQGAYVDNRQLVLDFERCTTYPLLAAAEKGRALRAFLQARTEDDVIQFTKNWGVLYPRVTNDETDRFPLALFQAEREKLLALVQLGTTLRRSAGATTVTRALQELKAARTKWHLQVYRREQSLEDLKALPVHERELADLGIPISQLLRARTAGRKVSLQEHAAEALAAALQLPQTLRAVRRDGKWQLHDAPAVHTLEEVLRLSYRSEYRVLRHFFCESCGEAAVSSRSDARFCGAKCGGNVRVRRFRDRLQRRESSRR